MKKKSFGEFEKWVFKSWVEADETATALCFNGWFYEAINCCRDGDMGCKGPDGVYDRVWGTDWVGDNPRRATQEEVAKWLNHCHPGAHSDYERVVGVFWGDETFVLIEKLDEPKDQLKVKNDVPTLTVLTDEQMVALLREHGWTVSCVKQTTSEL